MKIVFQYNLYFILISIRKLLIIVNYRKQEEEFMGCQYSVSNDHQSNLISRLRRDKKKKMMVQGRSSGSVKIFENVKRIDEKLSSRDKQKMYQIVTKHFFFSNFSQTEREDLINHFHLYSTQKNQYVFKKGQQGSLFFIIKEGQVTIEINDRYIKTLKKYDYFGDLSLLHTATRSASIKVSSKCVFWCLHQVTFRSFSSEVASRNYKTAKPLLQNLPIFQFMTKNQIHSLGYASNQERYSGNKYIFKQGDDANSFYIIVEGQVKIQIPGKDSIWLKKGQSFGENCFKQNQIRSGTAVCGPSETNLISISREGLIQSLGGQQLVEIAQFNILRWSLIRSKVFRNIPTSTILKIMTIANISEYLDNEIIMKKNELVKYFFVPIDRQINEYKAGQLINEQYFINQDPLEQYIQENKFVCKEDLKKIGKGLVFKISIPEIETFLGLNLNEALATKIRLFNQSEGVQFGEQYKVELKKQKQNQFRTNKLKNDKLKLKQLKYISKLGAGQFGNVLLVEDSRGQNRYALKCIKKKLVIQYGMEELVLNEKKVLQQLEHPLIVKLVKTFKDEAFIYFLLEYIQGVDFFDVLRQIDLCSSSTSKFYLACLILAIEQLHTHKIIYRDLKPQNVVVDLSGYLRLIDMGAAKKLFQENGNRTFTVIGTPHYMAPEIIIGKGYSFQADIWSLGVILYQMVCGKLPFGDNQQDPYKIFEKIKTKNKITYPSFYTSKRGKKLIQKLLDFNFSRRHVQNFLKLKDDPYFEDIEWEKIVTNQMKAPFRPSKSKKTLSFENNIQVVSYLAEQIAMFAVRPQMTPWDQQF